MNDKSIIYLIYAYFNLITGKYVYVGQTTGSLKKRASFKYKGSLFGFEIEKYGWQNFRGEILAEVTDREYADTLEWFYTIELGTQYPNGCNFQAGRHLTDSQKENLSHIFKGRPGNRKGAKLSSETRQKIANSVKGYKHTEEAKRKMSEANRGRGKGRHTPEDRKEKIANTLKAAGYHWYTDGTTNVHAKDCPKGFYPGRKIN